MEKRSYFFRAINHAGREVCAGHHCSATKEEITALLIGLSIGATLGINPAAKMLYYCVAYAYDADGVVIDCVGVGHAPKNYRHLRRVPMLKPDGTIQQAETV